MEVKKITTENMRGVLLPILELAKLKKGDKRMMFKINTTLAIPVGRQVDVLLSHTLEPEADEMLIFSVPPKVGCIASPANVIPDYPMEKQMIFLNVTNQLIRLEMGTVVLVVKRVTVEQEMVETKKKDE